MIRYDKQVDKKPIMVEILTSNKPNTVKGPSNFILRISDFSTVLFSSE